VQDSAFITKISKLNQAYKLSNNQITSLFQGKEPIVVYIPEAPKQGIQFVNKFRKKGVFNEVLIPTFFMFENRKLNMMNYIRDFKHVNPNVKVVNKFKIFQKNKINLIDLTGLVELFYITIKFKSKFKILTEFFNYINQLLKENGAENRDVYVIYEGTPTSSMIIDLLFKLARRKGMKLDSNFVKAQAIFGFEDLQNEFQLYPLVAKIHENNKEFLFFKYNVYKNYSKNVLEQEIIEEDEEENIENTKQEVLTLIDKVVSKKEVDKLIKNSEEVTGVNDLINSDSQVIDDIYNKIIQLNPNQTFEENLKDLLKETDKKTQDKIKKIIEYINIINKKYNGTIKLNKKLIQETANLYYDPLEILGIDELNIYNKHATEFDTILDNAMYDLIKSIEKDKDAALKILKIENEIIDTNKSRFKEYRVKIKPLDQENVQPYTIKFRVPYPVKNKYFKLDSNTYIMINQFYSKPVMKVKPNMVRLYTHYSTLTVSLKNHKLSETQGIETIFKEVSKLLKAKISWNAGENEETKLSTIKERFDLPEIPVTKLEI